MGKERKYNHPLSGKRIAEMLVARIKRDARGRLVERLQRTVAPNEDLAGFHPAHAACRAIVPAGYRGRRGELWYARVLPPPIPGSSEHVVFTTPYILLRPGPREWQACFDRTLPAGPRQARLDAYERYMKYGPTRTYWNDFVFEAYVNHRMEAIYLAGLPDIPESWPHSEVTSRRFI